MIRVRVLKKFLSWKIQFGIVTISSANVTIFSRKAGFQKQVQTQAHALNRWWFKVFTRKWLQNTYFLVKTCTSSWWHQRRKTRWNQNGLLGETHFKRCFRSVRELRKRKFEDTFTLRDSINTVLLTCCLTWLGSCAISVFNFLQLMNQVLSFLTLI